MELIPDSPPTAARKELSESKAPALLIQLGYHDNPQDEYLSLKAVLHVFGVNIAEIERERNQDFGAYGKARNPGA